MNALVSAIVFMQLAEDPATIIQSGLGLGFDWTIAIFSLLTDGSEVFGLFQLS